MFKKKRILFLGAHCDDLELGCGGLLARFGDGSLEYGDIKAIVLSNNLKNANRDIVSQRDTNEQYEAFESLNLPGKYEVLDVAGGQVFPEDRQKLLDYLYNLKKNYLPDLVFAHWHDDAHQDHRVVYDCVRKCFNRNPIIFYQNVNSTNNFPANLVIELNETQVLAKIKAVSCFKSVMSETASRNDYFSSDVILAEARLAGLSVGKTYGESYHINNWVIEQCAAYLD